MTPTSGVMLGIEQPTGLTVCTTCCEAAEVCHQLSARRLSTCLTPGIALQGGMPGAERLRDDPTLQRLLQRQAGSGRLVTAMCASD